MDPNSNLAEQRQIAAEIRDHVRLMAWHFKAKIWPNGLGFDYRGWEYVFHPGKDREGDHWSALYRRTNLYGEGVRPESARRAALAQRAHANRDPHCTCNTCLHTMLGQAATVDRG